MMLILVGDDERHLRFLYLNTVTDEATNGNERFMRDFVDGDCEADVIDEIQLAEISQLVRSESEVQAAQGARS